MMCSILETWDDSFGCSLDVIAVNEVAMKWRFGTANAQLSHVASKTKSSKQRCNVKRTGHTQASRKEVLLP